MYRFEVESRFVTVLNTTEPTILNVTLILANPRVPEENAPAVKSMRNKTLPVGTAEIIEDEEAQKRAEEWFMNSDRFSPLPSYSSIEEFDMKFKKLEGRSSIVAERTRISDSAMLLQLSNEVSPQLLLQVNFL